MADKNGPVVILEGLIVLCTDHKIVSLFPLSLSVSFFLSLSPDLHIIYHFRYFSILFLFSLFFSFLFNLAFSLFFFYTLNFLFLLLSIFYFLFLCLFVNLFCLFQSYFFLFVSLVSPPLSLSFFLFHSLALAFFFSLFLFLSFFLHLLFIYCYI